jgi:protein-disulfide isomerase
VCRFHVVETEPQIVSTYVATGKVKLVYRHLLQLGPDSVRSAEASECAADQDQFWPMHGMLYERQDEIFNSSNLDVTLQGFAQDLGLDTATFADCMATNKHLEKLQAGYQAAQAAGIRSRPVFDVNGKQLIGGQPFPVFQRLIDEALPR